MENDHHSEQHQQPIPDQPERFVDRFKRNTKDFLIEAVPVLIRVATYTTESMLIFYISLQEGISIEVAGGLGLAVGMASAYLAERYLVPWFER